MISRKLFPSEMNWVIGHNDVQLAYKCANKRARDSVLNEIANKLSVLHMRIDDGNLIFEKQKEIPIFKIPNNLKTFKDQCNFVEQNFMKPYNQRIGILACSDDTVVVTGNHCAFDGGTVVNLTNYLSGHAKEFGGFGLVPSMFEPFKEWMKTGNIHSPSFLGNPEVTKWHSKDVSHQTYTPKYKFYTNNFDEKQLQCYNKKEGKIHGLTEAYMASGILSCCALTGDFSVKGLWEVFGTRPCADNKQQLFQGDFYTQFHCTAQADKDTTVAEFMKRLRKDFNFRIKQGAPQSALKDMYENVKGEPPIPGIPLILTSIGTLRMGGPITDAYLQTNNANIQSGMCTITSYNVITKKQNRFATGTKYNTASMSDREAKAFADGVTYCLTKISPSITCGKALDMLESFQKKIFKENNNIMKTIKVK